MTTPDDKVLRTDAELSGSNEPADDWWDAGSGGSQLHLGRGPSAKWVNSPSQTPDHSASTPEVPTDIGTSPINLTVGPVLLMAGAILIIVGSVTPWATATIFGHSLNVDGTARSISSSSDFISGWISLIGGLVLVLLGGLMIVSRDRTLKAVSTLIALATSGYSVYAAVRLQQQIEKTHHSSQFFGSSIGSFSLGWGLMMVVAASLVATTASYLHARSA